MLGDNIKLIMEKKKIKSKDLADKVNITQTYLSYILNNKKQNPSKMLLEKIAKELDVTVDTFFKENNLIDNIEILCKTKGISSLDLAREINLSDDTIENIRNNIVPNDDILNAIADYFNVTVNYLITGNIDNTEDNILNDTPTVNTTKFDTPEEAMRFILSQPAIMGYGGFDIKKLNDQEIIDFGNELLYQLQILSYKYKK